MSSAKLVDDAIPPMPKTLTSANDQLDRQQARQAFTQQYLGPTISMTALPADASFRRYFRVARDGRTWLLMDAPPSHENLAAYLRVAAYLHQHGLAAPRIEASDLDQGFALIEDFGDRTYTTLLQAGGDEGALYALAIDALATLHSKPLPDRQAGFTAYTVEHLLDEAALFADWYWAHVMGESPSVEQRDRFIDLVSAQLGQVGARRDCVVLRDYHVDNLMLRPDQAAGSLASCGLLDFQDALIGSPAYDLMSLLEDARRDLSPGLIEAMIDRYCAARPEVDRDQLMTDYTVLGMTRHAKILGIFVRLSQRDGKPKYLVHLPRVARLLAGSLATPKLQPIADFLDDACPAWRQPPAV